MTTLSAQQDTARKVVVEKIKDGQPLTTMTGFAGSGKSTILPFILDSLGIAPETVAFVAPTGKAAKVMRTKLKAQGYANTNAGTIHSAIYRAKPAPISQLETDLENHREALSEALYICAMEGGDPDKDQHIFTQKKLIKRLEAELSAAYREDKINFQLNPDSAIQLASLIVVDEASMVGRRMTDDLMEYGVPIFAMGDPGQLPPVEDDAGLLANDPDFFLSEIHRQAQDNPIIHLSTLAREGKDLPFRDYGSGVKVMRRAEYEEVFDFEDRPQFIVGRNKTRWNVNQQLRSEFGYVEYPGERVGPQKNEPLIIRKNVRDNPDLTNGTEVTSLKSVEFTHGDATFQGSFSDENGVEYHDKTMFQGMFEEHFSRTNKGYTAPEQKAWRALKSSIVADWAYAITCHASQGSQWDDVVLIDESGCFRADEDKWLYTGITRAAKTLTILR
ncbi:RecD-like DNA helicase [Caulobacter phage Ccr2]|uniref:Exodeoxyribonuclease V n=4 Tax=Viruses TaxID=10239 RepID=J3SKZ6_9CAUD|nr:Dda-like helicase [Caulobacter virus Magneto]AFO71717.1 exodeoxyribonuclease V [Caulobacter phage phiCbK]ARB13644.1 RecD-like DNA helicase [Caulobacter phage Ccr10]ARB13989.1 RecD-like DNA helicase [Caulobacter phage Ccr2]ARB14677.1 RecD-like DNA helicase [Caulobacter phage Ccr29]ARB15032.1 RecD-like DNA helicase [Caulobacter phage Ccr32]ARB15364.1 RecD-like DNA helicase [Caulobacter phage Ccr34]